MTRSKPSVTVVIPTSATSVRAKKPSRCHVPRAFHRSTSATASTPGHSLEAVAKANKAPATRGWETTTATPTPTASPGIRSSRVSKIGPIAKLTPTHVHAPRKRPSRSRYPVNSAPSRQQARAKIRKNAVSLPGASTSAMALTARMGHTPTSGYSLNGVGLPPMPTMCSPNGPESRLPLR